VSVNYHVKYPFDSEATTSPLCRQAPGMLSVHSKKRVKYTPRWRSRGWKWCWGGPRDIRPSAVWETAAAGAPQYCTRTASRATLTADQTSSHYIN